MLYMRHLKKKKKKKKFMEMQKMLVKDLRLHDKLFFLKHLFMTPTVFE